MFTARGRLITESFAREVLPALPGVACPPPPARRAIESWSHRCDETLGPASSVRAIADVAIVPLLRILEYEVIHRSDTSAECVLQMRAGDSRVMALACGWGEPLSHLWRRAVLGAVASDAGWCLCCNGRSVRLVDGRRTWSRGYFELDVPVLGRDPDAQWLLWSVARAETMAARPPLLDRIVDLSQRHGSDVCRALADGVLEALQLLVGSIPGGARPDPPAVFGQALTVLYRLLFLLFAEARGLLPLWHPVYRERYSLGEIVTTLAEGRRYRGLWHTVRAISRLAHAGCTAGELKVTAFNGRLFSPAHAAAFDTKALPDDVMNGALVAVGTMTSKRHGRARIAYRDLDVEQLGAVYEQVLEYEPSREHSGCVLTRTRDARKSTGSFYTPRAVTAFLVRRTLEPLVRGQTAARILELRVVDPAMGSGAFLVAACRYLAAAAEGALIREGTWHLHEVTAADRAGLRREIASRCLFGVDLNPMAVQLARLSLWLATLASDKPLSFLDHHLICGDSLVGASPDDVARASRGRWRRCPNPSPLPLFEGTEVGATLEHAVRVRMQMMADPDDSPMVVRAKEKALARLQGHQSQLGRWSRVMDLWCAGWFWPEVAPSDDRTFGELARHILGRTPSLPGHVAERLIASLDQVADRGRFVHWPIAFPEVFVDDRGNALPNPGFDAVIGNPPWDMVRGDSGDGGARAGRRAEARRLTTFVRESGVYRVATRAHVNRYQLFLERALQLTRADGRTGLVLPSGITGDTGSGALRRHLFDRADVDEVTGIDNREGIFPIHRGLRFILLSCTRVDRGADRQPVGAGPPPPVSHGGASPPIRCRFGITRSEELEREDTRPPLLLTRALLGRLSGEDDLGIPELASERELRLVERICSTIPRLASVDGWGARFGRELNASDDRAAFTDYTGEPDARPILEGKQLEPFRVSIDRCRVQLRRDAAARVRIPRRTRVAYRDVASAGNRLTLIAALVPARAVTTHTLFCLRTSLPGPAQHVLCALLNSFVANYLIRLRVNTHVTLSLVSRLPVPLVRPEDPLFGRLATISHTLTRSAAPLEELPEYAELQAIAARLYGLDAGDFERVLSTFPLIAEATREAAYVKFNDR